MINRYIKLIILLNIFLLSFQLNLMNSSSSYSANTPLSMIDSSIIGESTFLSSGYLISDAGDVNGDGYDDFIICAYKSDYTWKVYLIFGKSNGWIMDLDIINTAGASFLGSYSGEYFQVTSISDVGDINGDGYDEVMIGTPYTNFGGIDSGQTFLFYGKKNGWESNIHFLNSDVRFIGNQYDWAGYSIAGAGDVNGDGFDDILIGAYNYSIRQGKTYLIFGNESIWPKIFNLSNADVMFIGENPWDDSGKSVSSAGDVNGDGYDDFIIGAKEKVYLIFGKKESWQKNISLSNADVCFYGDIDTSISNSGDVNNDGFDDFLISGSVTYNGTLHNSIHLILGKNSGWMKIINISNINKGTFIEEDPIWNSYLTVTPTGDINGDSYDDILIGAPHFDNDSLNDDFGKVYLNHGKKTGWIFNLSLNNSNISFIGEEKRDLLGVSIAGAGDINGDGFDDVIIGANLNDEGGPNVGQTYLIFPEKNTRPSTANSVTLYVDNTYSSEINQADIGWDIFIELNGTDGDPSKVNVAEVKVNSSITDIHGIKLRLQETGNNTGVYRGNFKIMNLSHESHSWIGATGGETITVYSVKDNTKFDTISVKASGIMIIPFQDNNIAFEDIFYNKKYASIGISEDLVLWSYNSNATWLNWGVSNHTIYGIPTNENVGQYWIRINISYNNELFDEHNFTLNVVNVNDKPVINTEDINIAFEDIYYENIYNAEDVDYGDSISWNFKTNSSWLDFNLNTALLNGTPTNDDVGQYWINVTCLDLSNAIDFHNFTLKVLNKNDVPIITPLDDNKIALEDEFYSQVYNYTDIDGNEVTWFFNTNASWLNWGEDNHTLYGTPTNDDVGNYWVRINITDNLGGYDEHYFNLTVININDAPMIIDAPTDLQINAYEDYILDLSENIIDIDNRSDELNLITETDYAYIKNLTIIFNYPNEISYDDVKIIATDGIDFSNEHIIEITIIPKDISPPTILDKSPVGGNVSVITNITISFSKSMNQSSVENSLLIFPQVEGTYNWINNTLILDPNLNLDYDTKYNITLNNSASDTFGNKFPSKYCWEFSTIKFYDRDGDGWSDDTDTFPDNPLYHLDTDGDGMADEWEDKYGLNKYDPNDADADLDKDGKSNREEFIDGTDPTKKDKKDGGIEYFSYVIVLIIIFMIVVILYYFLYFKARKMRLKKEESEDEE